MRIERLEDKIFMITLTEKEALRLSDNFEMDYQYVGICTLHIGRIVLHYMSQCCEFPDIKIPPFEQDL